MWNLPGPGIKPMSPALTGRFLTHCATKEFLKQVFSFFFFKAACLVPLISVASPYSTNSASCIHITISQGSRKYRNKHVKKVEKSSQSASPSKQSSKKVRERSAAGWENDHFQTELNCQKKREGFKGAASDNHTERSSKSLITTQRQVKTTRYQGTTI